MNSIIKKLLLIGFMLLPSACAHYPQHYSYYPDNDTYSSGYIMHRNYYGVRPNFYDNGYDQGRAYFPHRQHHDQQYVQPDNRDNDYSGHRYQQNRSQSDYGYNRQHDDSHSRRNNFDRNNYY